MSVYIYISAVVYNSDILNLTYIYNVHDILQKISNVIQKNVKNVNASQCKLTGSHMQLICIGL